MYWRGEVLFKTEAGKTVVGKGGHVNIPFGGAIHCFKNMSDRNARLLCTVVPAGLLKVFEAVGVPVPAGEFAPRQEMMPEFVKRLQELDMEFGQKTYRMDFLD